MKWFVTEFQSDVIKKVELKVGKELVRLAIRSGEITTAVVLG